MPWQEVSIMSQRREFVALAQQEGANRRAGQADGHRGDPVQPHRCVYPDPRLAHFQHWGQAGCIRGFIHHCRVRIERASWSVRLRRCWRGRCRNARWSAPQWF